MTVCNFFRPRRLWVVKRALARELLLTQAVSGEFRSPDSWPAGSSTSFSGMVALPLTVQLAMRKWHVEGPIFFI